MTLSCLRIHWSPSSFEFFNLDLSLYGPGRARFPQLRVLDPNDMTLTFVNIGCGLQKRLPHFAVRYSTHPMQVYQQLIVHVFAQVHNYFGRPFPLRHNTSFSAKSTVTRSSPPSSSPTPTLPRQVGHLALSPSRFPLSTLRSTVWSFAAGRLEVLILRRLAESSSNCWAPSAFT